MQIRLTVTLGARGSGQGAAGAAGATGVGSACDVLVTAPAGTPLSAVTGGLVSTAAAAASGSGPGGGQTDSAADSAAAVYAGTERLDPHRQLLGEPPLLDGAVISLHGPALPSAAPALAAYGSAKARLHVVSGPDAGGIHLLQGGKVRLGRSAEADVPLDDPDVSRLHCAVTVSDGGAVTVSDLGSTNGTTLDGAPVGAQPVLFRPGSTLRVGESALRIETSADEGAETHGSGVAGAPRPAGAGVRPLPAALPTEPDGHGQLRLTPARGGTHGPGGQEPGDHGHGAHAAGPEAAGGGMHPPEPHGPADSAHGYAPGGPFPDGATTHGSGIAQHARYAQQLPAQQPAAQQPGAQQPGGDGGTDPGSTPPGAAGDGRPRSRGGLSAWARRFTGGQPDGSADGQTARAGANSGQMPGSSAPAAASGQATAARDEARRPDPATVLLTALGPGPRLWEREPGHPEAMTVRIGTAHRGGGRPGEPVTVDLREAGALGLAGPRPRLTGLARSVLAQLAALHGPSSLEMVLVSADRSRDAEDRVRDWSWMGWLPHLRPARGQDCRLLTAYDRDQAAARVAELTHRLEESRRQPHRPDGLSGSGSGSGSGAGACAGPSAISGQGHGSAAAAGSARESVDGTPPGPYTLLIVDGDPGSASLRDAVARLAAEGPRAGIHLLCLAETPAATPSSPVPETVRAAYETSAAFRECGALALLSGAVATAVRVVRREAVPPAPGTGAAPAGTPGTVCTLDAVSAAWAERFARAMAPLRESEGTEARTGAARSVVSLPASTRLLDELGLARATPAALLARWAESPGRDDTVPGRAAGGTAGGADAPATLVFGAGPRGPLSAELGVTRGHVLVSGPSGSGKTELLRSLAASLAVSSPPDRLQLVLVDGDGATGDGLHTCLELPHARHHLAANDPGLMREFAQSLSGEIKRRAELIGVEGSFEDFTRPGAARAGERRAVQQRRAETATGAGSGATGEARAAEPHAEARADAPSRPEAPEPAEAPATLRLRTRTGTGPAAGDAATGRTGGGSSRPGADGLAGAAAGSAASAAANPQGSPSTGPSTSDPAGASSGTSVQYLDAQPVSLPRIIILVDDFDTLADPSLGNPGRPAAGSVMRALESVARDGARLGVHLVAATGRPDRTAGTALAQGAALRAELARHSGPEGSAAESAGPGRGTLTEADGSVTAFQAGRISGRIPRTATQRPTVVPLEWERAGDPPARRPVRELGNGPTDLALLASAVARAATSLGRERQESGMPAAGRSRSGQDEVLES